MRAGDVLREALTSIWRRRGRTVLAVLGVAAGCFVLTSSVAVGQGVHEAIASQLRRRDQMRWIQVWPGGEKKVEEPVVVEGEMSEERRARLAEAIKLRREKVYVPTGRGITPEQEAALAALDGVVEVRPALSWQGRVRADRKEVRGMIGVSSASDEALKRRVVAGSDLRGGGEGLMVSEYVAYTWGIPDEALIGREVTLDLETAAPGLHALLQMLNVARPDLDAEQRRVLDKVTARLPEVLAGLDLPPGERKVLAELLRLAKPGGTKEIRVTLPVRGVFRDVNRGELTPWDATMRPVDVYVPPEVARRLHFMRPGRANRDVPAVSVLVRHEDELRGVQARIKAMGLDTFSLSELVDEVRFNARVITVVLTLLALIALVVAALGIANTMLMSVLQRTHEIGVMKALGARDGQVLALFLSEGVLIGSAGGLLGLLAGWLVSYPGDAFARWLIRVQTPMRLEESVFAYPWWLVVGAPLLACGVTTLAAYFPARRAARIDPVAALRERG
jgi:putative ABC transport system permease protein